MIAVPGKPINTGSHQEMRSSLLGQSYGGIWVMTV
jgi:hypothetical protein